MESMNIVGVAQTAAAHCAGLPTSLPHAHAGWAGVAARKRRPAAVDPSVDGGLI